MSEMTPRTDTGAPPPRGSVPASGPAHDDASAVGWHGHSDDFDLPVTQWRPVQTVVVTGDRL